MFIFDIYEAVVMINLPIGTHGMTKTIFDWLLRELREWARFQDISRCIHLFLGCQSEEVCCSYKSTRWSVVSNVIQTRLWDYLILHIFIFSLVRIDEHIAINITVRLFYFCMNFLEHMMINYLALYIYNMYMNTIDIRPWINI